MSSAPPEADAKKPEADASRNESSGKKEFVDNVAIIVPDEALDARVAGQWEKFAEESQTEKLKLTVLRRSTFLDLQHEADRTLTPGPGSHPALASYAYASGLASASTAASAPVSSPSAPESGSPSSSSSSLSTSAASSATTPAAAAAAPPAATSGAIGKSAAASSSSPSACAEQQSTHPLGRLRFIPPYLNLFTIHVDFIRFSSHSPRPGTRPANKWFDWGLYFRHLNTVRLGAVALYGSTVSSTQTILTGPCNLAPVGIVFACDRQVQGRGKQNELRIIVFCRAVLCMHAAHVHFSPLFFSSYHQHHRRHTRFVLFVSRWFCRPVFSFSLTYTM